jgi:hypothetical protein
MIKIQGKYCSEFTYCLIPTIKTFRNNFTKTEGIEWLGDNYFIGLKWFNQVVGINIKIKSKNNE